MSLPLLGAGGAGVGFAPSDLSGLVLWLDPTSGLFQEISSPTTPASANGDPVGTWVPRTGPNYAARANSTRGTRQTVSDKIRVRLDGTDDFLETTNAAFLAQFSTVDAPCSVAGMFQMNNYTIARNYWSLTTTISTTPFMFIQLLTATGYTKRRRNDANSDQNQSAGSVDTAYHSSIFTYSGSSMGHYVDGVEVGTPLATVSGALTANTLGLGALSRNTPGNWLNGDIGNFCVFNRVLSASEITQMDTFLRAN